MGLGNLFRSKYENRNFEFSEEKWLQAVTMLDAHAQKQKRKKIFLWLSAAILISALSVLGLNLEDNNQLSKMYSDNPTEVDLAKKEKSLLENMAPLSQVSTNDTKNVDFNRQIQVDKKRRDIVSNYKSTFSTINANPYSQENNFELNKEFRTNDLAAANSNPAKGDNNYILNGISDQSLSDHMDNDVVIANVNNISKDVSNSIDIKRDLPSDNNSDFFDVDKSTLLSEQNFEEFDLTDYQLMTGISAVNFDSKKLVLLEKNKDYYKPKVNPFSLNLFTGYQTTSNQLTTESGLTQNIADKRKSEESSIADLNYGIELMYSLKKFNFSTGLNYSCYGENLNYTPITNSEWIYGQTTKLDVKAKTEMEFVDNGYWESDQVYSDGVWVTIERSTYIQDIDTIYSTRYDSSYVQVSDSTYLETQDKRVDVVNGVNTFKALEIPIMIGYELNFGKFGMNLRTGISMGYIISSSANYLDNEGIILVEKSQVNQWVPTFIIRPSVWYGLNERLSIYAEPQWKQQLEPLVKVEHRFSNKYQSYGLNIGLTYKFK